VLALIPARGGSKGLPGKNILPAGGRPLLDWTIAAARASRYIDRVVLSSDDDAIIAVALACGCDVPFRRPAALASDSAPTMDVVLHALDQLPDFDIVVLLQPTSPLRTTADIDAACERMVKSVATTCVSVTEAEQSPYWMYQIDPNLALQPIIAAPENASRRQDLPKVYVLNGAVYVADTGRLRSTRAFVTRDTIAYVMPPHRSIDIDTAADFEAFTKAVTEGPHA